MAVRTNKPVWSSPQLEQHADPIDSARAAKLRHVLDVGQGIRRLRAGKGFRYIDVDELPITDPDELARIRSLAIPPAWTKVWICPVASGHLQATGFDARGRKQYRYHPRWRVVRDETKYSRLIAFAMALPRLRAKVEEELARPGLNRTKVLSTVVRLLETTFIRVGNEEYARQNRSYGLTTFRNHHVEVTGTTLRFRFRGKSGIHHTITLQDQRLARIVKRCQELPGHELFQYEDEAGAYHPIDSSDVNSFLQELTGEEFTAKDFRTWAGTVLAARELRDCGPFASTTEAKRNIVQAIAAVAACLGNTKAVCRKCYIHPGILEAYLDGTLLARAARRGRRGKATGEAVLRADERFVLRMLKTRLARGRRKRQLVTT